MSRLPRETPRSARYHRPSAGGPHTPAFLSRGTPGGLVSPRSARFHKVHNRATKKYELYCSNLMRQNERAAMEKKIDVESSENRMKRELLESKETAFMQTTMRLESVLGKIAEYSALMQDVEEQIQELKGENEDYVAEKERFAESHSGLIRENRLDMHLQLLSDIRLHDDRIKAHEKAAHRLHLSLSHKNKVVEQLLETLRKLSDQDDDRENARDEQNLVVQLSQLTQQCELAQAVSQRQHAEINRLNRSIEEKRPLQDKHRDLQEEVQDLDMKLDHLRRMIEEEQRTGKVRDERLNQEAIYDNEHDVRLLENEKLFLFSKIQKEVQLLQKQRSKTRTTGHRVKQIADKLRQIDEKLDVVFRNRRKKGLSITGSRPPSALTTPRDVLEDAEAEGEVVPVQTFDRVAADARRSRRAINKLKANLKTIDAEVERFDKQHSVLRGSHRALHKKRTLELAQWENDYELLQIEKMEKDRYFDQRLKELTADVWKFKQAAGIVPEISDKATESSGGDKKPEPDGKLEVVAKPKEEEEEKGEIEELKGEEEAVVEEAATPPKPVDEPVVPLEEDPAEEPDAAVAEPVVDSVEEPAIQEEAEGEEKTEDVDVAALDDLDLDLGSISPIVDDEEEGDAAAPAEVGGEEAVGDEEGADDKEDEVAPVEEDAAPEDLAAEEANPEVDAVELASEEPVEVDAVPEEGEGEEVPVVDEPSEPADAASEEEAEGEDVVPTSDPYPEEPGDDQEEAEGEGEALVEDEYPQDQPADQEEEEEEGSADEPASLKQWKEEMTAMMEHEDQEQEEGAEPTGADPAIEEQPDDVEEEEGDGEDALDEVEEEEGAGEDAADEEEEEEEGAGEEEAARADPLDDSVDRIVADALAAADALDLDVTFDDQDTTAEVAD